MILMVINAEVSSGKEQIYQHLLRQINIYHLAAFLCYWQKFCQ
jgi:hypothetical protein